MEINKRPTVSNGIRALSFEIWTANLAQSLTLGTLTNSLSFISGDSNWKFCQVGFCRHLKSKTWHSNADISDLGYFFFNAFIIEWKKSKPVGYTRTMYSQTGKNTVLNELKLLFDVYYWFLKLYTGIIWHSYFPPHGFCSERAAAGVWPRRLTNQHPQRRNTIFNHQFHLSAQNHFLSVNFHSPAKLSINKRERERAHMGTTSLLSAVMPVGGALPLLATH